MLLSASPHPRHARAPRTRPNGSLDRPSHCPCRGLQKRRSAERRRAAQSQPTLRMPGAPAPDVIGSGAAHRPRTFEQDVAGLSDNPMRFVVIVAPARMAIAMAMTVATNVPGSSSRAHAATGARIRPAAWERRRDPCRSAYIMQYVALICFARSNIEGSMRQSGGAPGPHTPGRSGASK